MSEKKIAGKGAQAIFYRQLLEYKKERFFIFDKITLISLIFAFIFSYSLSDSAADSGVGQLFFAGRGCICVAGYERISREMGRAN